MSFYLDTSLLVAAFAVERHTEAARRWLYVRQEDELFISDWSLPEFASALALKVRTGQLEEHQRQAAADAFAHMTGSRVTVLGVDKPHFRSAAELIERSTRGLRAGDALHLAVSASLGLTVCTLDRGMEAAAEELGLPAVHP